MRPLQWSVNLGDLGLSEGQTFLGGGDLVLYLYLLVTVPYN